MGVSRSFHNFSVDGKKEDSYEQSLVNGITKPVLFLRL